MIHRPIGTAISAALALLAGMLLATEEPWLSPAAAALAPAGPSAPKARSPLARGPVADLNIAFTAQTIGWIEPCG